MSEPLDADQVARKTFSLSFRGFDQHEVRAYLGQLAGEIASSHEQHEALRARTAELEADPSDVLDEAALEAALGREATRVIHAAREAAAEIRARAEREAAAKMAAADAMLAKSTVDAETVSASTRAEVEAALRALRADTERQATAILEESRAQAAAMVEHAAAERDRVLAALAEHRRRELAELERLSAARERLMRSFETVRASLEVAVGDVGDADDDVRSVTATVSEPAAGWIELEVVEAPPFEPVSWSDPEPVGIVPPAGSGPADESIGPPVPEPEIQPEAEPEWEPEPPSASDADPGLRRSSALRLVPPAAGTPVMPAAGDDVERVRIVRPEPEPDLPEPAPVVGPDATAPPEPEAEQEVEREREAEQEPEREPEPVTDVVDSDEEPVREAAVDDLFARLRADRSAKVATAEAVLADATADTDASGPIEPEPLPDLLDLELLATRDGALGDIERTLVRSLKRALADEQNEVLDRLRRLRERPALGLLLPEPPTHDDRYGAVLRDAAEASAAAAGSGKGGERVAADLGRSIAADLRARIDRAIDVASGDVETLTAAISAAYREWKTARVEPLARDLMTAGYAAGAYAGASGPLRWVVDPGEGGCPDCDDNALAGPTPKGTAFPTGQLHPPAHAGCRCLAVPAT